MFYISCLGNTCQDATCSADDELKSSIHSLSVAAFVRQGNVLKLQSLRFLPIASRNNKALVSAFNVIRPKNLIIYSCEK